MNCLQLCAKLLGGSAAYVRVLRPSNANVRGIVALRSSQGALLLFSGLAACIQSSIHWIIPAACGDGGG
eukprot:595396-Pleurochrysis_carterae.AAC.1